MTPLSAYYTQYTESVYDLSLLLFDRTSLHFKRLSLINYLMFLNIPPNLPSMLNIKSETVIKKIINSILEARSRFRNLMLLILFLKIVSSFNYKI